MEDGAICQQIFVQRGIDPFFSHFQMVNTKEKEFVINNETLMVASKIIDAQSWCTFHFIRNVRQTAVISILKLKIIRHNHEKDEKKENEIYTLG